MFSSGKGEIQVLFYSDLTVTLKSSDLEAGGKFKIQYISPWKKIIIPLLIINLDVRKNFHLERVVMQ